MALAVLSLHVIRYTPVAEVFGMVQNGAETPVYHALMMVVLTFSGLVMLFRICQPFNLLRAILFITSSLACLLVISIPFLGEIVFSGWSALEFSLEQALLLIIIIQATFPLSNFLIKAFDLINPADE